MYVINIRKNVILLSYSCHFKTTNTSILFQCIVMHSRDTEIHENSIRIFQNDQPIKVSSEYSVVTFVFTS